MKMKWVTSFIVLAVAISCLGCQHKKTRIEGPEKKTEVKIETTEKSDDDD